MVLTYTGILVRFDRSMVTTESKRLGFRYLKVADDLRGQILDGKYESGHRLPRQHDLAKAHGVSFSTLNRALDILESEGYVSRKIGQGTYAAMPTNGKHPTLSQQDVLEAVMNSIPEAVIVVDTQGNFVSSNPAAQWIVDFTMASDGEQRLANPLEAGQTADPTPVGFYLPDKVTPYPTDQSPLVRALNGQSVNDAEILVKGPKLREPKWLSVNATPLRNPDGQVIGAVAVARDFTERKRAEELLERQTQRLATSEADLSGKNELLDTVLSSLDDGLIAVDKDGKLLTHNEAAEPIIQLSVANHEGRIKASNGKLKPKKELVGGGFFLADQVTPMSNEDSPVMRATQGERLKNFEVYMVDPRLSKPVWLNVNASPMKDEDGTVQGGVILARDISELKEAQRALETEKNALAKSNRELELFAYIASHDLQEPLRSISGFTGLLKRRYQDKLDAKADGYISRVVAASERMKALINDLLSYPRVARKDVEFVDVDSGVLVQQEIDDLKASIQANRGVVS